VSATAKKRPGPRPKRAARKSAARRRVVSKRAAPQSAVPKPAAPTRSAPTRSALKRAAPKPAARRPTAPRPGVRRRAKPHSIPSDRLPRGREIVARLERAYPDAHCALHHRDALQLLIATILSAQCTDARVNMVTPALFAKYPDAEAFAEADRTELEEMIRSTGFYHNKAKNIIGCCQELVMRHGGKVPQDLDSLVALPGVGRKTANVVLGNAFGIPGVVVDTHVSRLSQRLDLTSNDDPNKIEIDLMEIVPRDKWTLLAHLLIEHGRRVCMARSPRCAGCVLSELCPSSQA